MSFGFIWQIYSPIVCYHQILQIRIDDQPKFVLPYGKCHLVMIKKNRWITSMNIEWLMKHRGLKNVTFHQAGEWRKTSKQGTKKRKINQNPLKLFKFNSCSQTLGTSSTTSSRESRMDSWVGVCDLPWIRLLVSSSVLVESEAIFFIKENSYREGQRKKNNFHSNPVTLTNHVHVERLMKY